jgi:hypothetical protein
MERTFLAIAVAGLLILVTAISLGLGQFLDLERPRGLAIHQGEALATLDRRGRHSDRGPADLSGAERSRHPVTSGAANAASVASR